jgi:hypothetical protein
MTLLKTRKKQDSKTKLVVVGEKGIVTCEMKMPGAS